MTESNGTSEPVEPLQPAAPVAAAEHVGAEPALPELDDQEVVDEVAAPVPLEPVQTGEAVDPGYSAVREVVYVQAPTPPAPRHNRGFGVLISLLGAIAFALLYMGAAAVIFALTPHTEFESTFSAFLAADAFWIPVVAYAVFAVVLALIVNRAAWWAHVLGSLAVAALSYAVSLGALALLRDVVAMTPADAAVLFASLAGSPLLIAVAVLAREVAMWFGLASSARGRRVKERNAADRAAFEQTVADRRAEYERAHPAV